MNYNLIDIYLNHFLKMLSFSISIKKNNKTYNNYSKLLVYLVSIKLYSLVTYSFISLLISVSLIRLWYKNKLKLQKLELE
jgi:hypothetical protein